MYFCGKAMNWKKYLFSFLLLGFTLVMAVAMLFYFQQDKIKASAIDLINKNLDAEVNVEGAIELTWLSTFPKMTLELNEVFIADRLIVGDTLAYLNTINCNLNLLHLLRKNIKIESIALHKGVVKLRRLKDARNNYEILGKKDKSKQEDSTALNLEEIFINEVQLLYDDRQANIWAQQKINMALLSGKFYQKEMDIAVKINANVKQLNINKATYISNRMLGAKVVLHYNTQTQCVVFKQNTINIDDNDFVVNGNICTKQNSINLQASAKGKYIEKALKLVPTHLFSTKNIKGKGAYFIDISLKEKLNKPKLNLNFTIENASIQLAQPNLEFSEVYGVGSFSNFPQNNLVVKEFAFKSQKSALQGSLHIPNFKQKRMQINTTAQIDLQDLNAIFKKEVKFEKGKLNVQDLVFHFNYRPIDSLWQATKLQGNIDLQKVKGIFKKINKPFAVNAQLKAQNKSIKVEAFHFLLGENDIAFQGTINNALNYFQQKILLSNEALQLNGKLLSKQFNINDFLEKKETEEAKEEIDLLRWLNIQSKLQLSCEKVQYKNLVLEKLKALVKSDKAGMFQVKNIQSKVFNGSVSGDVDIRFFNNKNLEIGIDGKVNQVAINKVFDAFDNFEQKSLTSKNIKGNVNAEIKASMLFTHFKSFQSKDFVLYSDFVINKGELVNLEALQSLAKYLSVEQLKHIYFSRYKSSIAIVDEAIHLKNNKIKSNVLSLELGGTHYFTNEIDYKIKLNLTNLLAAKFKKKKTLQSDYVNDIKGGINLFITMQGDVKNPSIKMGKKHFKASEIEENTAQATAKETNQQNIKEYFTLDSNVNQPKEELYFEEDEDEYIEF